jgi:hypothetical protein
MVQFVIAIILFFVLFFGIGFILNMLMKTTWFPIYGYIVLLIALAVWVWRGEGSLIEALAGYSWVDYTTAVGGLAGCCLSGVTIKTLRKKGYKMF